MDVVLSLDMQSRIEAKVQSGEYKNSDALIQQALDWFLEIDEEDELDDTQSAVEEAREQSARGETMPAGKVFEELRAKYGISR